MAIWKKKEGWLLKIDTKRSKIVKGSSWGNFRTPDHKHVFDLKKQN